VPKCAIYNRSDFHDFFSIKSLGRGGGQLVVKNKKNLYLGVYLGQRNSYAYAQSDFKELFAFETIC
jgi:hypothetical protein